MCPASGCVSRVSNLSGEYDGAPVQFSGGAPPSTRLRATLCGSGARSSIRRAPPPVSSVGEHKAYCLAQVSGPGAESAGQIGVHSA